jgi:hypothetical protein
MKYVTGYPADCSPWRFDERKSGRGPSKISSTFGQEVGKSHCGKHKRTWRFKHSDKHQEHEGRLYRSPLEGSGTNAGEEATPTTKSIAAIATSVHVIVIL